MAPSPDDLAPAKIKDKDAFVQQLPKRVAAIEDIWAKISDGNWDQRQLDALYERVQEISESSKTFGLFQLNESVFSLEVYLSSFVGADIEPGEAQVDAISGLLRALRTASDLCTASEQEKPSAPATTEVAVFMLGDQTGITSDLATALGKLDCKVEYFARGRELLDVLQSRRPKVIVADAAKLNDLQAIASDLEEARDAGTQHIPLLVVSDSSALQQRVEAIRAGSDGFFVAPLDAPIVAKQIRDLMRPEQTKPFRVLIVEDDPTQAEFAGSILKKSGIETLEVTEPVKVIDQLRTFKPDLILMDIYMPEVNGLELTTVIRDLPEFVAVPIVFLSGEQNTDKQLDALSVGGDDFVAKPIRPKHLLTVVESRIRRSRQVMSATGQPPKRDRVTGLFSRKHLLDRVARVLDANDKSGVSAVVIVRPDHLPDLKLQLGIGGIDHLMAEFGGVIMDAIGDRDVAARIDEHTFGVLLKRDTNAGIEGLAKRLLSQLSDHCFSSDTSPTGSIGLCVISERYDDATGILNRAKAACDQAGAQGGNRIVTHIFAETTKQPKAAPDNELRDRVRDALNNDSFIVQYQPMLDLQTRGSEAYEILLRVANAEGDLLGDRELIEAADAAGVATDLDHWILDHAIDILKKRRDTGRRTQIFAHQSVYSALDSRLPDYLSEQLHQKRSNGTGLVLDFRLPDISHDLKAAKRNIGRLRDMDIEVSLSRFPEKDAAFKVLKYLHANYINIAPRLLKADRAVISSVIRQAHEAAAKVIVSNIDDPRSIDLHWSSGADYLQGNFIQRALEDMDYDFSQVVI